MLDKISNFFNSLFHKKKHQKNVSSNDVQIAISELLFHVALSDEKLTAEERKMIYSTAEDSLGVPITFLEKHLSEMNKGIDQQINLDHIAHILKQELSQESRDNLVQYLMTLSYVDGQIEAEEDYRVWEIAQLLDVETARPLSQ